MASGSTIAVYSAIIGNSLVMVSKFVAFFVSGSSAMLSSGIHSFADLSNQSLLALGIAKSTKKPTKEHPYGFARESFIWALISAMGIFFVGCGVTIYHGVHIILDPKPIHNYTLSFIVLALAFIIESMVLTIALKHSFKEAKKRKQKLLTYFFRNSDPMTIAVVLEDSAAIIGIIIAALGISLSYYTNNFIWDGIATLVIGFLLAAVAITLIIKTKGLLLGKAVYQEDYQIISDLFAKNKIINHVHDVKSMIMGTDIIRFKAEIDFNGKELTKTLLNDDNNLEADFNKIKNKADFRKYLIDFGDLVVDKVGKEVNKIENQIQESNPDIKYIDLETH
ncbi:MAG: zinc transporter 9 [Rickettsiales bacterium]|jgi:zinc transporter 9